MRKKSWLALGIALSMLAATGCAGGSSSETTTTTAAEAAVQDTTAETSTEAPAEEITEAVPQDQEYSPITDHVKCLGRTYENNDTLWMAYSGSGVEFEVTGKALSIILYGDSTAIDPKTDDGCARYAIYVDGERVIDEMMNQAAKNITIFEGEEERTATVRVVKLSETASSVMGIREIDVTEGEINPTPDNDLYIEFVGDSITCGYGVDDEDRNNHFSTTTEDVTKTYAYKTAQALNADYSMVSISGYGIISGYSSDGTIKDNQVMGKYYDKLGFSYTNTGSFNVADIDWSFEREPDVVVINLGTNDSSYVGSDADRVQEYLEGYVAFLKQVREKNPDAYILCTLGLMGDSLYPTIEEAVATYSEETGDEHLSTFHFDPIKSDEGYAADWHPTEATHTRAAEQLTQALKDIIS